jgi:23S rRNA pseudouridine2605 synthase
VRAHGKVTQGDLDRLRNGVTIDGIHYGAIEATLDREQGSNVWLTFAIREGKNREVKKVLGHLGLVVNRLIRVSFGPFQLGELAEGAIEEVRTRVLREQLGERVAKEAGADFSGPLIPQQLGAPAKSLPRHPEVRAQRASKGDGPVVATALKRRGRASFEGRLRRPPQDDGDKSRARHPKRQRPDDHLGEPEKARREKRRGRKFRGKGR